MRIQDHFSISVNLAG